ncbi:MAG: hypothetical protein IPG29_13910 [Sphingobacteriales bacterium]|nr:hypothetical protein [Sphingobacteriales bacterium]
MLPYAVAVIVENCACPSPTTSTPPHFCNDAATLDLSTLTLPTTDPGGVLKVSPAAEQPALSATILPPPPGGW